VVVRVADLPFGPVTVAFVVPPERVTLREAVLPLGPVVDELTLPALRVAVRVAVFPFGPVTVVFFVCCAEAPVAKSRTAAALIQSREFIVILLFRK